MWFRPEEKLRRFGDCLPTIGGLLGTPKTNWRDPAQERLKTSRRKWEVFLENLLLVTRAGFLLRSFAFKEKQLFMAGADCLNCVYVENGECIQQSGTLFLNNRAASTTATHHKVVVLL